MRLTDYLDRKHATKTILREWRDQEYRLNSIGIKVDEINDRMTSLSTPTGSTPVQGGASKAEDRWISGIDKKTTLEEQMRDAEEFFEQVLPPWNRLTDEERYMLEIMFIDRRTNGVGIISERLGIQQSAAYERVNNALSRLARLLF